MIWPSLIGTEYVGGPYVHCGVGAGVLVAIDGQTPYTLRLMGQASLYVGVVQFSYKSKQVDKSDKTAF